MAGKKGSAENSDLGERGMFGAKTKTPPMFFTHNEHEVYVYARKTCSYRDEAHWSSLNLAPLIEQQLMHAF